MINLTSTSDTIRVITASAALIECHASFVDVSSGAGTLGRINSAPITTATTTTIVTSPGAGVLRNVKHLNITNASASASSKVTVDHFDGTTATELMSFILLPGENMILNEEGRWTHRDAQGAEYPPSGLGAFNGSAIPFMKSTTSPEGAGSWYCTAKDNGFPGAWSPGAPGVNGRVTDGTTAADAGSIPFRNPAIGANFITELQMASSVNHTHLFFDVLWVNTGLVVTTTTAQAIAMPTLPARDVNGTTNGEGCMIAMLFTAAATNAAAISNATVSYTNSAGVSGRTATLTSGIAGSQIPATPVIGTLIWFNLAAGDKGVQSIQSVTLGTSLVTGSISMMIARDLATIGTTLPNVSAQKIIGAPGIRCYNNQTVLHCLLAGAATVTFLSGELTVQEK
jgi:hypothetical protein